jgi:hypothetical protein
VVRLIGEPSLWCWELRDAVTGALVESSWSSYWMAFESRGEARADGLRRLAAIVCPGGRPLRARSAAPPAA